jgi:hypothetical protein
VELATRALSSLGKAVAQSMQLRRARVTPAIWVSVHDPPEKGSLHIWSHTLLLCVAKRMCSRHGRRVWRWWMGFERKGSGPLLPSRFLTDQPPFFPTKQHPHVCFQQKTSKDPISKRTCMTWSPNLAGITTTQEDRLPESRNQNTRAKIFRSSKSLMQVI